MNTLNTLRHYFKEFVLWELLLGLEVTGRYLFAKRSRCSIPEAHPLVAALPRPACFAVIPTVKNAVLPASCARRSARTLAITIESEQRGGRHPSHHPLRYRSVPACCGRVLAKGCPFCETRSWKLVSITTLKRCGAVATPRRPLEAPSPPIGPPTRPIAFRLPLP